MSFGYGVSDFIACARLSHAVYTRIRDAPAACRMFSKELLHFHGLLADLAHMIEDEDTAVDENDIGMLSELANGCKELLWMDILGCTEIPESIDWSKSETLADCYLTSDDPQSKEVVEVLDRIRLRIRQTWYARRIPNLRRKIGAIVAKLTACLTILTR